MTNINHLEEADQKGFKQSTLPASAARKPGGNRYVLLLFLVGSLVYFPSTYFSSQLDAPTGDEPHYLVISQTLLLYHSLDVTRDYTHGDYKTFYLGPLGPFQHTSRNKWGNVLPLHSIGAPIFWLIPFALAGKTGTLFFMSLVSLLVILNMYLLLVSLGIQEIYAFVTSLGVTLASPIWVFSHHNFVEPMAALLCIYSVRVLFQQQLRTGDILGISAAIGILPWIHIRFALFEIVLCGFLFARVYEKNRFGKIMPYLSALLPMLGLFLLFEAYTAVVWGSLNPAANQIASGEGPFDSPIWRGLLGLLLDQGSGLLTNFPIFLLLLGGIILALRKWFLRFNLLALLLSLPYLVTIASFHNWDGAISPPARFLNVLVPLLAFYLALALQQAHSWIVTGLFLLFLGVTLLFEEISFSIPGGWINREDGYNPSLLRLEQTLHLPLTEGVPSFFTQGRPSFTLPEQAFLIAGWLALLGGLTLIVILLADRQVRLAPVLEKPD